MKTKSAVDKVVSFPNGLEALLTAHAARRGKAFAWVVRDACLQMLASNGVDVSNIPNPEGRGVRSDLRKLPSVPESSRRPKSVKRKAE